MYVHFHDIFFPFEYPRFWIEEGRAWNEAYVLRAPPVQPQFEVVLFNTLLSTRHRSRLGEMFPLCLNNNGRSIWLRRMAPEDAFEKKPRVPAAPERR